MSQLAPVGPWYKICMVLWTHHKPPENPYVTVPYESMDTAKKILPQDVHYNASAYAADEARLHQLLKAEKEWLGNLLFELMAMKHSTGRDRSVHVALQGDYSHTSMLNAS